MGAAVSQNARQSRQASQMQQCARLLISRCHGPPDLRQYRLASMLMNPCLQQQSTFCTGDASDISNSNDSVQKVHKDQPEEDGPNISMLAKEL
ncbi:hypothetical protein WJX82_010685 [Trebouxia sp. C0006]